MSPNFESHFLERLNAVENRHRRLKRFSLLLLALIILETLWVAAILLPVKAWLGLPTTVEANRFVMLDEAGRVRGEWGMDNGPRLTLSTEQGSRRASLWVNHTGAARLTLLDNKNGAGRVAILSAHDDSTELELMDAKTTRLVLTVAKDRLGLRVNDEHGKPLKP